MVNFKLGEEIRKDGIFSMLRVWDKEKIFGFSKWQAVKQVHRAQSRTGGNLCMYVCNQGYLQKMMCKSKIQDNRTDGRVIMLLKSLNLSALFA